MSGATHMRLRPETHRPGFTFVELLLVMLLGMILLGGAYTTLIRQEHAYAQFRASAGAQEDVRTGLELLASELRELSTAGGDLVMAAQDSVRFRALRKFAIACDASSSGQTLVVSPTGMDPFVAGDSVLVYVDGDSLQAYDDRWLRAPLESVSSPSTCDPSVSSMLGGLLGGASLSADLKTLKVSGTGSVLDSVYPGAPVRAFEVLTYRVQKWGPDDQWTLVSDNDGVVAPLVGPMAGPHSMELTYFDEAGNELTSLPLSATDRASVRRIRVELEAVRKGAQGDEFDETLSSDIFVRGS